MTRKNNHGRELLKRGIEGKVGTELKDMQKEYLKRRWGDECLQ